MDGGSIKGSIDDGLQTVLDVRWSSSCEANRKKESATGSKEVGPVV